MFVNVVDFFVNEKLQIKMSENKNISLTVSIKMNGSQIEDIQWTSAKLFTETSGEANEKALETREEPEGMESPTSLEQEWGVRSNLNTIGSYSIKTWEYWMKSKPQAQVFIY